MAYVFGSRWNGSALKALNDLAKNLDTQGKSIQDLVAEGQLTPTQYADLIQAVNGNVSKGNISIYDIDKNRGKLDSTYFSSDFLAELNNGTIESTKVLPGSITNKELARKTVSQDKTTFLKRGKNIFDKENIHANKTINGNGNLMDYQGFSATDFIDVVGIDNMVANHTINVAQYDSAHAFIEFKGHTSGTVIIKNPSAAYIRVSVNTSNANNLQLEEGRNQTSFEEYKDFLRNVTVTKENLGEDIKGDLASLDIVSKNIKYSKNLVDGAKFKDGFSLTENGNEIATSGYSLSDFIKIEKGETYVSNLTVTVSEYRNDGAHIRRSSYTSGTLFVTNINTDYVKISVATSNKSNLQFEKGTQVTPFEPYHEPKIGGSAGMSSPLDGKKVLFIGDSNTHLNSFPNAIANRTGAVTYNGGFGGTRLSDLSQVNTTNNYHKLNGCAIADAIATQDFSELITATEAIDVAENQNSIPKYRAQLQNIIDACADMSQLHAVVLKYGTNDVNNSNFQLGTADSLDPQEWNGAINYFVKTLSEKYPHVQIYFCSPVFRMNMPQSEDATGSKKHSDEWAKSVMLPDMAKAMKERANDNHVPFKDLYNESGINKYTAKHYLKPMPADGTHYTIAGDALIADKIEKFLLSH